MPGDPNYVISINMSDHVQYNSIVSLLGRIAGISYSIWPRPVFPQNPDESKYRFWFPTLAHRGQKKQLVPSPKKENSLYTLSDDGLLFSVDNENSLHTSNDYYLGITVLFAKDYYSKLYIFRGVYILDRSQSEQNHIVYKRISDSFNIHGKPINNISVPKFELIQNIDEEFKNKEITGLERETIVKCRVNQNIFRDELLTRYKKCCLCGVTNPSCLLASHIKPWSVCEMHEKLDVDNGLLLCPNHDKLFDGGLISFDTEGRIMISSQLDSENRKHMNVDINMKLDYCGNNNNYMEYHRKNLFIE